MNTDPVVILAARRTPVGAFQGVFAGVTAPQLGAVAIKAALADSGVAAAEVDEVIMGCVLSAGLGQAPARQAALGAGIPPSAPATTVNKMCGSGDARRDAGRAIRSWPAPPGSSWPAASSR